MKCIKYQLMTETDRGTVDAPDIQRTFSACEITCADDKLEGALAAARAEAYNGEVTVEDAEDEAAEPTEIERIRADVDYLLMMQEG